MVSIIQANWPQLIAPHTVQDSSNMKVLELRHNYTGEEAAALRAAGINVLRQLPDGTIYIPMGGGITINRKSMTVTRKAIGLADFVKELQSEVMDAIQVKVSGAGLPTDTKVRLEWRDNIPFAVTDPPAFEIDLTTRLSIPPL